MATTFNFLLTIFSSLFLVLEARVVRAPSKPNALVIPVFTDVNATNLHVAHIRQRTPQVSIPLLIDLNGRFLWVACNQNYISSTYNAPICHSLQCSLAGNHSCHKCSSVARPGCHNNTCAVIAKNPLTQRNSVSELGQDVLSIQSMNQNKSISRQWASIPQFLFACSSSSLLGKLPQGVQGVIGLSHSPISLPTQLASHFGFQPEFFMCLANYDDINGWISFGNKIPPYFIPINFVYTPMTIGAQGEYFVFMRSIIVNYREVPLNSSLLSRTRGFRTVISTTTPYTILEQSIYKAVVQYYAEEMRGVPQVKAIPPFGLCFNRNYLPPTRVGTPNIDFIFHNQNISLRIFGVREAISIVRPEIACLTFVDGGSNIRAPITIGIFHLQDNLLHFDLSRSRLGFNPSRYYYPTRCSKFNINSTANHPTMD